MWGKLLWQPSISFCCEHFVKTLKNFLIAHISFPFLVARSSFYSLLKLDMPILTCIFFTFNWLTLTSEMHFVKFHPCGSFLFTLQRQKKVCTPGDEAVMKIHKKLFSGIPINFTIFGISPKLQRIWSWNFGFAIRKIWTFIWYQKIYYFRLSPGGWECDRHKGL